VCLRLWDQDEQLLESTPPEIEEADLAPMVLELSLWWGTRVGLVRTRVYMVMSAWLRMYVQFSNPTLCFRPCVFFLLGPSQGIP